MGGIKQLVCIGHTHTGKKATFFRFLFPGETNNKKGKIHELEPKLFELTISLSLTLNPYKYTIDTKEL